MIFNKYLIAKWDLVQINVLYNLMLVMLQNNWEFTNNIKYYLLANFSIILLDMRDEVNHTSDI